VPLSVSTRRTRTPRRRNHATARRTKAGVLYRVIDEHLETFLDAAAQHADGHWLPKFVEQEFRDFLTCGVLAPALRGSAVATAPSSG
jgi:hypothetical protein